MDFNVLDASAFYAGVPFRSPERYCTTQIVYNEIMHIKKDHDALGTLLDTGRLKIMEPDAGHIKAAARAAKETGDWEHMSKQDVSVVALGLETGGKIITDDYAVSNVAENLGIHTISIMTVGIRDVGKWIRYCPGCRTSQNGGIECTRCGTKLKRKLIK